MPVKQTRLSWAAGIIDGEGCIRLVRRSSSTCKEQYCLFVKVNNTEIRMLEELRKLFGGRIYLRKPGSTTRHQSWDWQIWTLAAERMIKDILPFLVVKKDQAETALLARTYMKKRRGKNNEDNLASQRVLSKRLSDQKYQHLKLVRNL